MDDRSKWKNKYTGQLFEAILQLEDKEECERFFRDLMTIQEIKTMASRFEAARLINTGLPYREISEKTGLSTTTVTRVNNWLEFGLDGYNLVLERLNQKTSSHHTHTTK